jgi:indolepyruvate ferredoxin oxidoreductase, beta subunit
MKTALGKDPYNVIITGVGGQGNVIASRMLGNILAKKGYAITIGETFGVSQRGGSVMSHIRISASGTWSPQMPKGKADLVVALEPIESLRVMAGYGNPETKVLSNSRPVYPVGVIAGDQKYPAKEELNDALLKLSKDVKFIDATDEALKLGEPILSNVIMMGAIAGLNDLPFDTPDFAEVVAGTFKKEKQEINIRAFELGKALVRQAA